MKGRKEGRKEGKEGKEGQSQNKTIFCRGINQLIDVFCRQQTFHGSVKSRFENRYFFFFCCNEPTCPQMYFFFSLPRERRKKRNAPIQIQSICSLMNVIRSVHFAFERRLTSDGLIHLNSILFRFSKKNQEEKTK